MTGINGPGAYYPAQCADSPGETALPSWPIISIVLLLIISAIFPPGLVTFLNAYLVFLAVIVWSSGKSRINKELARTVTPFVLIVAIGLLAGIGADWYLYLKDVWYVANPALIVTAGFIFYRCKPDVCLGLRAFIIGGALVSLIYFIPVVAHPDILLKNTNAIRQSIGNGYYAPALALTILCAYWGNWTEKLKLPGWLGLTCFVVCGAAIVICFSRTILLVSFIGVLVSIGAISRQGWWRLGFVSVLVLLAFVVLRETVDLNSANAFGSFLGKLVRSLDEISIREYADYKSINDNWRGYETARALKTYLSGHPGQWVFGQGFGALVDLGKVSLLNMHQIPVFHNGYAYLLVKGGLAAVFLYGSVLFTLFRLGGRHSSSASARQGLIPARVLQSIALSLGISTWFIAGVFNKLDLFPYLLAAGFLLAALSDQNREAT